MGREARFICSKCGNQLGELLTAVQRLQSDDVKLNRFLERAREELNQPGYSAYVGSRNRTVFRKKLQVGRVHSQLAESRSVFFT
jgi:hypothetical protein